MPSRWRARVFPRFSCMKREKNHALPELQVWPVDRCKTSAPDQFLLEAPNLDESSPDLYTSSPDLLQDYFRVRSYHPFPLIITGEEKWPPDFSTLQICSAFVGGGGRNHRRCLYRRWIYREEKKEENLPLVLVAAAGFNARRRRRLARDWSVLTGSPDDRCRGQKKDSRKP